MARVTLERVTKTYRTSRGEVHAVCELNLDVADQELVVLAGPSGCGKTTTLRLIAGLEPPTTGTIQIGDRVVNQVAPKDRDVAMVFQNYALYPHMSVFDNMAFGLRMRRVLRSEIKRNVHETASLLGIGHLLERKPGALSGGERQRVSLGRAIVRRPQVFLFDEPLASLDARLRLQMRTEIKTLHRNLQATILHVTHDQEEAMILGDRLVILNNGVVQQSGTPMEVYNRPANRFVAGFVGTPSMNFLDGRLQGDGGELLFRGSGVSLKIPPEIAGNLRSHAGEPVVLGLRPEHLVPADLNRGLPPGGVLDRRDAMAEVCTLAVHVVEPLGDRTNVHFLAPTGAIIVARTTPTSGVSPGQHVALFADLSYAHFFAPGENGRRLGS